MHKKVSIYRLIDSDELLDIDAITKAHTDIGYEQGYRDGWAEADELIVRCKDCRFYEIAELKKDGTEDKRFKPSVCMIGFYAEPRDENWYCADGERRNEAEE